MTTDRPWKPVDECETTIQPAGKGLAPPDETELVWPGGREPNFAGNQEDLSGYDHTRVVAVRQAALP